MVDITANSTVYPSANDIAETEKEGRYATEQSHTELMELWLANHIVSGFLLPASDPDLTITIPAGTCVIDGRRVVVSSTTDITLTDAATNHIWVQLSFDGDGNVDGVDIVANTSGTPPANSIKIGEAVAAGAAITGTTDLRNVGAAIADGAVWGTALQVLLDSAGPITDTVADTTNWEELPGLSAVITRADLGGRDTKVLSLINAIQVYGGTGDYEFRYRDTDVGANVFAISESDFNLIRGRTLAFGVVHTLAGNSDHTLQPEWQKDSGTGAMNVRAGTLAVLAIEAG